MMRELVVLQVEEHRYYHCHEPPAQMLGKFAQLTIVDFQHDLHFGGRLHVEKLPSLRHITIDVGSHRWGAMGIQFDLPLDAMTGVHHGAEIAIRNTILAYRAEQMSRIMSTMRETAGIKQGNKADLSFSLNAISQAHHGPLEPNGHYELFRFQLKLENDDVFKLWYEFRGQEYEVVQVSEETG